MQHLRTLMLLFYLECFFPICMRHVVIFLKIITQIFGQTLIQMFAVSEQKKGHMLDCYNVCLLFLFLWTKQKVQLC